MMKLFLFSFLDDVTKKVFIFPSHLNRALINLRVMAHRSFWILHTNRNKYCNSNLISIATFKRLINSPGFSCAFIIMLSLLVCVRNAHCKPIRRTGTEERMAMSNNSCKDSFNVEGVCMFRWDCTRYNGTMLSACLDGFLWGTCCRLRASFSATSLTAESTTITSTSTGYHSTNSSSIDSPMTPLSVIMTNNNETTSGGEVTVTIQQQSSSQPSTANSFVEKNITTITSDMTERDNVTSSTDSEPSTVKALMTEISTTVRQYQSRPTIDPFSDFIQPLTTFPTTSSSASSTSNTNTFTHTSPNSLVVPLSSTSTQSLTATESITTNAETKQSQTIATTVNYPPSPTSPPPTTDSIKLVNTTESFAISSKPSSNPEVTFVPNSSSTSASTFIEVSVQPLVESSEDDASVRIPPHSWRPKPKPTVSSSSSYTPSPSTVFTTTISNFIAGSDDDTKYSPHKPLPTEPPTRRPEPTEINFPDILTATENITNLITVTSDIPSISEHTPSNQTNDSTLTTATETEVVTHPLSSFGITQFPQFDATHSTATTVAPTTVSTRTTTPKEPYNNRRDCGIRPLRPVGRVVGGRNAHFGEWPWQVLVKEATWLGFFVKTKCGGVLIDHKWVLTAAHCQPGFLGSLVVVLGEYDLTGDIEKLKPVSRPVRRMIVHRNYNPNTFENDIALLELESPFDIQPHVVPICLPEPDEKSYVGKLGYVAGWGKLSYGGPIPSILQVVRLPILDNSQCQKMFLEAGHVKAIRDTFLCAGYVDGGKDSCEGDSGGPMMVQRDDGHWVLLGTVSHGIRCAEPNLPGVYMKTTAYLPWINSIINKTGQYQRLIRIK